MPWWQIITIGLAAAGFLLQVGVTVVGATLGIARIRVVIAEEIGAHRLDVSSKIDALKAEFEAKLEAQSRSMGEVGAAARQKIHELELWTRDHCVQVGVINDIKETIAGLGNLIDKRLERIENRLYGSAGERE